MYIPCTILYMQIYICFWVLLLLHLLYIAYEAHLGCRIIDILWVFINFLFGIQKLNFNIKLFYFCCLGYMNYLLFCLRDLFLLKASNKLLCVVFSFFSSEIIGAHGLKYHRNLVLLVWYCIFFDTPLFCGNKICTFRTTMNSNK